MTKAEKVKALDDLKIEKLRLALKFAIDILFSSKRDRKRIRIQLLKIYGETE